MTSHMNGDLDTAVGQCLFAGRMPLTSGFESGLLDSVGLQEAVQLLLCAPPPFVVVEVEGAGVRVADDRVPPHPGRVCGGF